MIFAVIPARYNSKRYPGKLVQLLKDKTVIQHTYETALSCSIFDKVFVATDDERIEKQITELNGCVLMTSKECPNGTLRIADAVQRYPFLQKANIIVNIQADHPYFSSTTIEAIISLLQKYPDTHIATAAFSFHDEKKALNPHVVKCIFDDNNNALYFSRSPIPYYRDEEKEKIYYHHLGIYAYRVHFLKEIMLYPPSYLEQAEGLEQLRFLNKGYQIKIALVKESDFSIDTPSDLKKVQKKINSTLA